MWDATGAVLLEQELRVDAPGHVLLWSPDSATLVLDSGDALTFFDAAGTTIGEVASPGDAGFGAAMGLSSPLWSSDGSRFAYWAEDAGEARAFSIADGTSAALPIDGRPIAWVLNDQAMLVGNNYVPAQGLGFPEYEVSLVYLDGREDFQRRPELDRGSQSWLAPDRNVLAFLTAEAGVAFMDIASGAVTPIESSSLNYGSHFIPPNNVQFTDDGAALVWVDADVDPTTINRADTLSRTFSELSRIRGTVSISPDGARMFFLGLQGGTSSYVAEIDGSRETELAPTASGSSSITWRPSLD